MAYRCHSFFFFFFLSFFSVKKAAFVYVCLKKENRSCSAVSIDQNAFRVSYSRWRQQRLEDGRGVKRGLKSLCEAKLSSK